MALPPSAESIAARNRILAMVTEGRSGVSPSAIATDMLGNIDRDSPEAKNIKNKITYWLRKLTESREIAAHGHGRSTVYRLGNGRPAVELTGLPKRTAGRPPKVTVTPPAGPSNGAVHVGGDVNVALLRYIIKDIKSRLSDLDEALPN